MVGFIDHQVAARFYQSAQCGLVKQLQGLGSGNNDVGGSQFSYLLLRHLRADGSNDGIARRVGYSAHCTKRLHLRALAHQLSPEGIRRNQN
ncbi:hypothetical protein D3C80_1502760 [compost metagenome]